MANQSLYSKEQSDYINELYKAFGKIYTYPEFWDYVRSQLGDNPLKFGEARYQGTMIDNLYRTWANEVNSGKRQVLPQSNTSTQADYQSVYEEAKQKFINDPVTLGKIVSYLQSGEIDEARQILANTTAIANTTATPTLADAEAQAALDAMVDEQKLAREKFEWEKSTSGQPSWYERMQVTEAANQRQLQEAQTKAELGNLNAERLRGFLTPEVKGLENNEELANQWEQTRQDMIASLQPEARNWIGLYKAQNMVNPFQKKQLTADEEFAYAQERAESISDAADEIRKRMKDPNDTLTQARVSNPQTYEEQVANAILQSEQSANQQLMEMKLARNAGKGFIKGDAITDIVNKYSDQYEAGYWATPQPDVINGGFTVGMPSINREVNTNPEIPEWLQTVSNVKGKVPETRTEIQRPSLQMWNTLTPTQQSMYAGLVDWAGNVPYEDVTNTMAISATQPLSLGRAWKPSTKRV